MSSSKRRRRSFTAAMKTKTVEYSRSHSLVATGREFSVNPRTVANWRKAAGVSAEGQAAEKTRLARENLAAKRKQLRVDMLERAGEMLKRMGEKFTFATKDGTLVEIEKPPASVCKDLALTLAILVDKLRLEEGEVTERTETLTSDVLDREIERLEAELAQRPAGE